MDIPAAAGPWIALAVLLAVLLLAAAGPAGVLLRRRGRPPGTTTAPPEERRDDLAAFLEHPPGTAGALPGAAGGWAALGGPASPDRPAPVHPAGAARRPGVRAVRAAAVAVVVLLAAAVAALVLADGGPPGRDDRPDRDGRDRAAGSGRPAGDALVEARLSFGGVVLEPHAVGVTATYPELRLTDDDGRPRALLELPTWNCLAGTAPADPVAAGCRRTVPEVAELAAPGLEVSATDGGLRISGRFATATKPKGGSPSPTGRAYDVVVTIEAGAGIRNGWRPAEGVLELGGDRARTTGTDVATGTNVLRYRAR